MRAGWILLVGLCSCGPKGSEPESPSMPMQKAKKIEHAAPTVQPLPAGLYFRNGYVHWHDYCPAFSKKEQCLKESPAPTYAVIRGSFGDSELATKSLRELKKYNLAPGYPFAVVTYRLAPTQAAMRRHQLKLREAVIVAGLFRDKDSAISLAKKVSSKAVELMNVEESLSLAQELQDGNQMTEMAYVVQIGNSATRLISAASMKDLSEQLATRVLNPEEYERVFASACQVPAHSVIVMPRVDYKTVSYAPNQYLPAVCPNGQLAFVRRPHTRTDSIVKEVKPGKWQIHQVLSISCDMATTGRWQWGPNGRGIAVTTLASGGC